MREVALAAAAVTAALAVIGALAAAVSVWFLAAAGPPLALWAWVLAFFRDPHRSPPAGEGLLVSPADGRVADVTPLGPESPLGRDGLRVGVFMSVFNVHVNRSPCDGRVIRVEHRPGAFLDARDPHAAERNESAAVHLLARIAGAEHAVVVRQVAGLLARRIVTDVREGQELRRGERIGMIKFGSRLELLVPRELVGRVKVRVGQKVRAGETVLVAAGTDRDGHAH